MKVKWNMRQGFSKNLPIHHQFLDHVRNHPNKECIVEVDTKRRLTFEEVNDLSNKYANAFKVSIN